MNLQKEISPIGFESWGKHSFRISKNIESIKWICWNREVPNRFKFQKNQYLSSISPKHSFCSIKPGHFNLTKNYIIFLFITFFSLHLYTVHMNIPLQLHIEFYLLHVLYIFKPWQVYISLLKSLYRPQKNIKVSFATPQK